MPRKSDIKYGDNPAKFTPENIQEHFDGQVAGFCDARVPETAAMNYAISAAGPQPEGAQPGVCAPHYGMLDIGGFATDSPHWNMEKMLNPTPEGAAAFVATKLANVFSEDPEFRTPQVRLAKDQAEALAKAYTTINGAGSDVQWAGQNGNVPSWEQVTEKLPKNLSDDDREKMEAAHTQLESAGQRLQEWDPRPKIKWQDVAAGVNLLSKLPLDENNPEADSEWSTNQAKKAGPMLTLDSHRYHAGQGERDSLGIPSNKIDMMFYPGRTHGEDGTVTMKDPERVFVSDRLLKALDAPPGSTERDATEKLAMRACIVDTTHALQVYTDSDGVLRIAKADDVQQRASNLGLSTF